MGEGSDSKKQLGRILLQRRLVTDNELDEILAQQAQHGGRLASAVARSGKVEPAELLRALSEQQGLPAVDLRRVTIPLDALELVPLDICRERVILPLFAQGERLFLAMADPGDRQIIDELEFVTGKTIFPYVALHGELTEVIEHAYTAWQDGDTHYAGELADESVAPSPRSERPSMLPGRDAALISAIPAAFDERELDELTFDDELSSPLEPPKRSAKPPPVPAAPRPAPARFESPFDAPDFERDDAFNRVTGEHTTVAPPKRKLLVVDDSDDIRELLTRVFRERDYQVFESSRGLDALQQVRDHVPDVMVLDAMLPELHGFDICRRIKGSRRYGHIPVVMLSAVYRGWRFAEDLRRSYGVDAFLEKPFRIADVVAAVERALSGQVEIGSDDDGDIEGSAAEHLQRGIESYQNGNIDEAIEELKRGIALDPLAFRLHYHVGLLYGKRDDIFEAIQALETAVDLRPRDFSTLKNLAVLYQRAGFRLKATEMWERALATAPDDETRTNIKNHLVTLF